jgi:hypothetical protein
MAPNGFSNDFPSGAAIRIGSKQHKELFCRMLLDTHDPYKPASSPGRSSTIPRLHG